MSPSDQCSLGPFLSNNFGDRYLYPVNREAFNKVGSETIFRKRFGEIHSTENSLHIIVGLDSGLLLNFIKNSPIPKGSRVIFLEIPKVLERLKAEGYLEDLEEPISCLSIEEFFKKLEALEYRQYFFLDQVSIWRSIAAEDAHLPTYQEFYWSARDELERMNWVINSSMANKFFVQRQLENLADNQVSAQCLRGLFPGKTAVLLAGGPSLDEVLPWVKEHRENLVVLAVSRVARRLQEVELVPDMVFSIDPHQVSFDVSKEMLLWGERTLFVNLYHVVPQLLGNWQGRSVYLGNRFPWETDLNGQPDCTPGPTVTNVALASAVGMGFSQLILAGVDLCYNRSGHTHSRGSNEALAGPQFSHHQTRVETNGGWQAYTSHAMAQAIPILNDQASFALTQGCKFINPAIGAARISEVEHLPADQIEISPLVAPAWEAIQKSMPKDSTTNRLAHYKTSRGELLRSRSRMEKIESLCIRALKYNDGLFGRNGLKRSFKYKSKLDAIERELNRDYKDLTSLIKTYCIKDFLKLSSPVASKTWSDEEIEQKGRQYYEAYLHNTRQLIEHIQKALNTIDIRMQEEPGKSEISELFSVWKQREEPGRALRWLHYHPEFSENGCSEELNKKLVDLKTSFHAMIHNRETDHLKKRQADANPEIARQKAPLLFQKQDLNALKDLERGLESMDRNDAVLIGHQVSGYVAELTGDTETALDHYQAIVNQPLSSSTEEALRRILSISLGVPEPENALLALECLSGLSPIYIPQHADLLKLLGHPKDALDRYADYLEIIPDDPIVLTKVGKTYQEMGMNNEALTVFRHLQDIDPKNPSYQKIIEELDGKNRAIGVE